MSNITIELRPPPNVDFVHGFPGIPPAGPDRPQAAVKGAIEVRVPPTGVKAKWVRIELRKVEVLPPGGEANQYWDCIGPSPINLWTSPDEYGVLRTQDFPFSIRIPESIPPSVELDNRACITYELVASVCTKGKRGFLRKAKSVVSTKKAPITIDKHELHSTWPIYNQPEVRHMAQDGITLMVERSHTCFGPGDRIGVTVTVKSDSLHTVILRGFEIALKETTVLRAGPHGAGGRRTQPQSRTASVSENKVMLNATMYGGQQKQAELSCTLPPKHTTPTLNAARHIDVTYTLMVKAVMGTGDNLIMDLPVIISNWQRDISAAAIGQIGPTPNLSNLPVTPVSSQNHTNQAFYNAQHTSNLRTSQQQPLPALPPLQITTGPTAASTLPNASGNRSSAIGTGLGGGGHTRQNSGGINMFATANPAGGIGSGVAKLPLDEFGGYTSTNISSGGVRPTVPPINTGGGTSRPTSRGTGAGGGTSRPTSRGTGAGGGAGNRLTIMNAHPSEYADDSLGAGGGGGSRTSQQPQQQQQQSVNGRGSAGNAGNKQWLSAEEEKRLYEQARKRVETMQGPHAAPAPINRTSPPPTALSNSRDSGGGGGVSAAAAPSSADRPWLSAEEEKAMLFNKAAAAVARNQGAAAAPAIVPISSGMGSHVRTPSDRASAAAAAAMGPTTPGKQTSAQSLYQQAMSSRKNPAPSSGASPIPSFKGTPSIPAYQTAEQEKAAFRRYEEARLAVGRTQGSMGPGDDSGSSGGGGGGGIGVGERDSVGPIAYDALFPSNGGGGSSTAHDPPPPAFGAPAAGHVAILSEKERLRREYEARDNAALSAQQRGSALPPQRNESYTGASPAFNSTHLSSGGGSPPPPPFMNQPPAQTQYANAIAEKEALRRKFEAQDRAAAAVLPPPAPLQTPSRNSNAVPGYKPMTPPTRSGTANSFGQSNNANANAASQYVSPLSPNPRPIPGTPPVSAGAGGSSRVLTAAEEKALLRAKYEAQDQQQQTPRAPAPLQPAAARVNGVNHRAGSTPSPPSFSSANGEAPPPLMPRPPVEYIQETREEDERVARYGQQQEAEGGRVNGGNGVSVNGLSVQLDVKPFTPLSAGFNRMQTPPPALPPKPE